MRGNAYDAMQQVGLCGSLGVWGGLHLLSQVARAVQRIRGGPLEKGLLTIKKDQLQGHVRVGALHEGLKWDSSLASFSSEDLLPPGGSVLTLQQHKNIFLVLWLHENRFSIQFIVFPFFIYYYWTLLKLILYIFAILPLLHTLCSFSHSNIKSSVLYFSKHLNLFPNIFT